MRRPSLGVLVVVLVCVGPGCRKKNSGPAGAMPAIQVIAVQAAENPIVETLSLVGTTTPNEMIEIKSEVEGTVKEILFQEGQPVEKGALLMRLDELKLAAAVAEAEANFKLTEANHERSKQLFQDKLISQQESDQIASVFEATRAGLQLKKGQLKDARIVAPFAGIMGSRQISPGQVISKNTSISSLVDLDPVKVEVRVPEKYLRQLKIGQTLEFSVAAFPDEKFRGEIYFISPQIEESTRTALLKARIPNPDAKLRGGMFASLDLLIRLRDKAIVIPEPALMSNGDDFTVFVIDSEGKAQVRPVAVGLRLAGKAEVIKGLSAGDTVVVEGTQKLRPGAVVKMAPPEASAPYLSIGVTNRPLPLPPSGDGTNDHNAAR